MPNGVYFMKQTIGNACGTIGTLHAIANTQDKVTIGETFLSYLLVTQQSWLCKVGALASLHYLQTCVMKVYLRSKTHLMAILAKIRDLHIVCFS